MVDAKRMAESMMSRRAAFTRITFIMGASFALILLFSRPIGDGLTILLQDLSLLESAWSGWPTSSLIQPFGIALVSWIPITVCVLFIRSSLSAYSKRMIIIGWSLVVIFAIVFPIQAVSFGDGVFSGRVNLFFFFSFGFVYASYLTVYGFILQAATGSPMIDDDAENAGPTNLHEDEVVGQFIKDFAAIGNTGSRTIAIHLIRESERLRRLAMVALVALGALVFGAALIIMFAGLITEIDLSGTSRLQQARAAYDEQLAVQAQARSRVIEARELVADPTSPSDRDADGTAAGTSSNDPAQLPSIPIVGKDSASFGVPRMLGATGRAGSTTLDLVMLEADLKRADEELTTVATLYRSIQAKQIAEGDVPAQTTEALIASAVTRFGVVALLLFFGQALINLYRYTLRLSAFYRSRAYLFLAAGGDLERMEKAVTSLAPDSVSLGKEPETPMKQLEKLLEVLARYDRRPAL